jgi:hypothetical protein
MVSDLLDKFSDTEINGIKEALEKEDIPEFISQVHSIIKTIPNRHKKTNESYFHVVLHVILKATGCEINSEVPLIDGIIDSVVELDQIIYIIEYKLLDSKIALEQIKEKAYYRAYTAKNKRMRLLGLAFDPNISNISSEFETEVLEEYA